MLRKLPRRLAAPVAAAVFTSAVVAAIALGGSSGTQAAAPGSPPTPSGQPTGQLVIEGGAPITILSYSWGASNPGSFGGGGGGGTGKVSFGSLNMMKNVDASSAALMLACAQGKHLRDATFTASWGSGGGTATLKLELTDVIVDSVQQSGGGGGAPTESISLSYAKVKWTYTDATGTTSGDWDIANNSRI